MLIMVVKFGQIPIKWTSKSLSFMVQKALTITWKNPIGQSKCQHRAHGLIFRFLGQHILSLLQKERNKLPPIHLTILIYPQLSSITTNIVTKKKKYNHKAIALCIIQQ